MLPLTVKLVARFCPSAGSVDGVALEHEVAHTTKSPLDTVPVNVMDVLTPTVMLVGEMPLMTLLLVAATTVKVTPLCSTLSLPPDAL